MSKRTTGWSLGLNSVALVWLSTSVMAAAPAGSSVSFAYPPAPTSGSLTVNTIDNVYAEWTSSYAEAWLYFYCNSGANGDTETIFHQPVDSSGNAMVSLADQGTLENRSDWPKPLRCWFDLNYADKNGQGLGAMVVSVTSVAAEATTYSPGAAEASETPSPSSDPSSSAPVTTTATTPSATGGRATGANAQPTASSSSTANIPPASSATSLSGGAIAGIAIAAGAGVGAIAVIAFLLYRRSRKRNNYGSHPGQNYGSEIVRYGHEGKPYGVAVTHVQHHHDPAPGYEAPTYEMQGTDVQELSALKSPRGSVMENKY